MNKEAGWNKLEKIDKILRKGSKRKMLSLEGTDFQYGICSDYSGMDVILKDDKGVYSWHADGYFGDYACLKIFGHYHDFRTAEQKKGFRYWLSLKPWFGTELHASIINSGDSYELSFSSGYKESGIEETIILSKYDLDALFSEVAPDKLLNFSLMERFNGLLGVRGSIYIDGESNSFYYPVHIEDRIGQSISSSMLRLIDEKLQNPECREKFEKVKARFDDAFYYSWEPEGWLSIKDRGYITDIYDKEFESKLKPGDSVVDRRGQRYMIRGIEMFSRPLSKPTEEQMNRKGILLRPLGKHGEEKPARLYYISG